jgi:AraC-like DNA-binding protein
MKNLLQTGYPVCITGIACNADIKTFIGKNNMSKDKSKIKTESPEKAESKKNDGDALAKAFEAFYKNEASFQFLDAFPHAIEIFAPDGTAVYANRAGYEQSNIADRNQHIGCFNLLADPVCNDVLGLREDIAAAFRGEARTVCDIRVPYEDTGARYDKKDENNVDVAYIDISYFPLRNRSGEIEYIVMMFQTRHVYKGRTEIIKAQEYINENWFEEYDIDKIAQTTHMHPTYFYNLFKQYMNESPLDYYKRVKVNKIKEKLLDPNVSIAEAFIACNVDYSGWYVKIFRDITGKTPSEYRKEKLKTKV